VADLLAIEDDDPNDLDAIDKAWEEEAVTFGPETASDGCPKAQAMLNTMQGTRQ
jgi:nitrate reductase delta subunit